MCPKIMTPHHFECKNVTVKYDSQAKWVSYQSAIIRNETDMTLKSHWSFVQIAGCQPTMLVQSRYARFWMLKNVKNEFKILNVYKL